ncbi:MAG: DeoR/GlpR family DNA-binding transcription regulator [Acidimicrobiia bacterium]
MHARRRHDEIVKILRQEGTIRVSALADSLGVSEMTVRRDLELLSAEGVVEKFHGGAALVGRPTADEPGFDVKRTMETEAKESIARRAASRVRPGSSVGLTAGTTTWMLAKYLDMRPLTVVTNSISVAEVFYPRASPTLDVVLTGGVRTPSDALVGPVAVSSLSTLHIDTLFMGVHGMTERAGFTTPNLLEAETNRAFIHGAAELVVVADHTKFGVTGLSTICSLSTVDALIVDDQLDPTAVDLLRSEIPDVELV